MMSPSAHLPSAALYMGRNATFRNSVLFPLSRCMWSVTASGIAKHTQPDDGDRTGLRNFWFDPAVTCC